MTLIAQWCIFFFFCHFLNWKIIEQYPKWKFISAIEKKVIINLLIWIKMEQIWIKSFFYGIFVLFQQSKRKLLGGKNSPFLSYDFLWSKKYIVQFKDLRMNWTTDPGPFRCAIYLSLYMCLRYKIWRHLKIISLETKSNIIQE